MTAYNPLLDRQARSGAYFHLAVADYRQLHELLAAWTDEGHPVRAALAAKLRRGIACGPEPLHDIVTVGARVRFRRDPRGPLESATLVHPDDNKRPDDAVSVTEPFGALLLGLREGHLFKEARPDGKPLYLLIERVEPPVRQQGHVRQQQRKAA